MKYWLMKSEPTVYSINDLKRDKKTLWEGVRNYQARNFMTNEMSVGDLVLFYHSNAEPSGIAGLAKVSGGAVADPTQFDKKSEYFEPKARHDKPLWYCVQVSYQQTFSQIISLDALRKHRPLKDMLVLKRGQRLSVQPVTKAEFEFIEKLAKQGD